MSQYLTCYCGFQGVEHCLVCDEPLTHANLAVRYGEAAIHAAVTFNRPGLELVYIADYAARLARIAAKHADRI